MTTPLSKEELREFTRTLASEPELLTAFLESMIESVALQANVADLSEVQRDEERIAQNEQDIAALQTETSGKQDNLPDLADGQSWVGPSDTPTDIATQAELDAERLARVGQNTQLDERISNEIQDRTNADDALGTRIDGKQDDLPNLGNNQVWSGNPPVPTDLPDATSPGVDQEARDAAKSAQDDADANERSIITNAQAIQDNTRLIATNAQEITRIKDGKHDTLPDLGEGQGWLGPTETPTALATQAELDAETKARTDADALLDKKTGFGGVIGIVPKNIDTYTDLDGNYELAAYDFDASYLIARNVDQYEIWIKQQAVHTTQGTWAPVSDFVASFEIDTTEETQVGLTETDQIVPVRLVFRSSGSFVAEITTYLTIGDGGGGDGDVTTAQFNAAIAAQNAARATLTTRSDEGDDFNKSIITGNSPAANAALATFLIAQATSNNVGILEIRAVSATSGAHSYNRGDIVVFAPRSSTGKIFGNIAEYAEGGFGFLSTQVRNEAELNTVADGQVDDVHGEFVTVRAGFRYTPNGATYKAGDILWLQPRMSTRLGIKLLFNVGDPDEIAKLTDTVGKNTGSISISPNNIPNAAAIERDFVFAAEDLDDEWLKSKGVNELEIWFNNTAFHTVDPWSPVADVRLNVNVNATEARAINVGSAAIVPIRAVFRRDGQFVALINNWLTISDQAGEKFQLTQTQQIGLLSVHPDPSIIVYPHGGLETALTRTVRVLIANPEVLTGDIWVQGSIDGQNVLARRKWASNLSTLNFVISAQLAQAIGQNDSLDVRLDFYDAASDGTIVESLRYGVSLVEQAAVGQQGATAAQAAAIAANTVARMENAIAIAQNATNINTEKNRVTENIAAIRALSSKVDNVTHGIWEEADPSKTTPEEGKLLYWQGNFYTYRPKTLVTRDLLGSDFRQAGLTWRGVVANEAARNAITDNGSVVYAFVRTGILAANNYLVRQSGGWSILTSGGDPAISNAYPDLDAATAATNTINRVIIIPDGGFYVTGVLEEGWEKFTTEDPRVGNLGLKPTSIYSGDPVSIKGGTIVNLIIDEILEDNTMYQLNFATDDIVSAPANDILVDNIVKSSVFFGREVFVGPSGRVAGGSFGTRGGPQQTTVGIGRSESGGARGIWFCIANDQSGLDAGQQRLLVQTPGGNAYYVSNLVKIEVG